MVAAGGTADQLRLQQILRKRLLCSEGVESSHCYTKEAAQGSADAVAEVAQSPDSEVGRRFSLDASDTPPLTYSPPGSPTKETPGNGPEAWKANEDEAESTDGLPDQAEEGDLHYDWQFELMNSMPREKALELARVLKRSEQEKAKESAKLRQEVVELKRQMSNKQDLREGQGHVQRTSYISWRCMAFLIAVVVAAVGIAMKVTPQLHGESRLVDLQAAEEKLRTSTTTTMMHQELTPQEAIEKSPLPEPVTPAPSTVVPEVPAPAATPTPMPPVHSPMPKPPVLGAKVISGVSHTHLWHQALSQDTTALGPAKDATMKASLKAVGSNFPKVTEAYRFLQLDVSRALLDGRQVALQVTLQVLNVGVSTWPERTSLKLIHGVGMGLPSLMVGQKVLPGQHIDLSLQLEVPNRGHGDGNDLMRNMWVLVGRNDEPFGPLLVAEIRFTA